MSAMMIVFVTIHCKQEISRWKHLSVSGFRRCWVNFQVHTQPSGAFTLAWRYNDLEKGGWNLL